MPRRRSTRRICTLACLICVASLSWNAAHTAAYAASPPPAKIAKGPYLQALASTSVEIRAELDAPAPASITVTPIADAGAPRAVHDDVLSRMHVVRVDGLLPSTRYAYSLTVGANVAKGELTTAPPNDSKAPFSFLLYGDNRSDDVAHAAIVRAMLQTPADFVLNTGDLVLDGASEENWQSFFDIEAPLLRNHALFSCVGNHEITDGAGANYLRYFGPTSDTHGDGEKPRLYGSFRWANARFFLLNAMDPFTSDAERAWLDDELSRADSEAGLVWRIVVMHHSPWSAGPHGGNARALRAGIPALFAAHHVDVVFAGHDHIYERGFASGIRYVISGGGGAPLYEIEHTLPSTRKAEAVHHVIEVAVASDAMHMVAKRDDGSVLDRCGMTKAQEGWDCDPAPAAPTKSDPPKEAPAAPSASRWGCSTVAHPAGESLGLAALAALALVSVRVGRRRNRRNDD